MVVGGSSLIFILFLCCGISKLSLVCKCVRNCAMWWVGIPSKGILLLLAQVPKGCSRATENRWMVGYVSLIHVLTRHLPWKRFSQAPIIWKEVSLKHGIKSVMLQCHLRADLPRDSVCPQLNNKGVLTPGFTHDKACLIRNLHVCALSCRVRHLRSI